MNKTKYIILTVVILILIVAGVLQYSIKKPVLIGNASKAILSLSPASGSYKVGDTFAVDIKVNTNNQNIVVVAAYLNYDNTSFEATGVDLTGSVFNTNFEKKIDSQNGKIKITQAIPTPGVNTSNGLVAKINFKALKATSPSSANITFDFTPGATTESNVLDDTGTDYLSGVYNVIFDIN